MINAFLMMGQSNMSGRGALSDLPEIIIRTYSHCAMRAGRSQRNPWCRISQLRERAWARRSEHT